MSIKLSDSDPFSWIALTPEISKGNQWLCLIIIIINQIGNTPNYQCLLVLFNYVFISANNHGKKSIF